MTTITIEQAYEKGWIAAAKWANRYDLVSDIGSAAYVNDLRAALSEPERKPMTDEEIIKCDHCFGKGWNWEWMEVAGHYLGGEVLRNECGKCNGSGHEMD